MQFGGNDQWSNMLGGTELIRRKLGKDAHCLTITLLTDSNGKKMGKTAGNAVWLDAAKTTPYEFFQYWRNVGDSDVIKCMKMLTFIPIEEIEEMERTMEGAELNKAKERLAFELTKMVHGEEEAQKALEAARALFTAGASSANMPTTALTADEIADGKMQVADLLVKSELAPSKSEAKRLIKSGSVSVNDVKVVDLNACVSEADFASGELILKKGKKGFHKFTL